MQQGSGAVRSGSSGGARARRLAVAAVALVALVASGCTSGNRAGNGSPVARNSAGASSGSPTPTVSPATITTTPASGVISPITPIQVSIEHGKLTSVEMSNPAGRRVAGQLSPDGAQWHSTEALAYSRTYQVVAKGVDENGTEVTKTTKLTTLTPSNQTMPYFNTIYGSNMENGATYGVGMVVRVHFDEIVNRARAERTLHVTTSPAVTGGWYWADDQNAYWRPRNYYQPGTTVQVTAKVYGVQVGPGLYGQADQSISFRIGEKHYSVADASTHYVKVYFNDRLVRTMPTSMGQGGTTEGKWGPIYLWTMPGVYTVINHENPAVMSSDSYGLPANSPFGYAPEKVPYATKISVDGIYLHELDATVWAQGHQNVSHGCLNLNYDNAKWFYETSLIGDVVEVVHSGGPSITFNQGGQWSMPWSEWLKGSAL